MSEAVPKLFISYSWTSPEHEAWVLDLATQLRESGVDAIIDKWELKEGHDAYAFMEKMVTDPEIRKVILICDKAYAEKADVRSGGVGVEAQIISPEIYKKQAQDKFVAVIRERDGTGKPYVPTYYRSRIYIDMSDDSAFVENFEMLLRWAFDQPLHKKPQLGEKPGYLKSEAESLVALATTSRQKRALEGLRNDRAYAIPAVKEYLKQFSEELEKFRLDPNADPFDDAVIHSIDSFLPYRNEVIEIFSTMALHMDSQESRTAMHKFFENIIPYTEWPGTTNQFRESDWDNFAFAVHELFLYSIALLVRHERFEAAAHLMKYRYYLPNRSSLGKDTMPSFEVVYKHLQSLELRNQRLRLNRLSLRADLLRERCKGTGITFSDLMQADFILFMRSRSSKISGFNLWRPDTLVFSYPGPFEVFARSRSAEYFERVKTLLGIEGKAELQAIVTSFKGDPSYPRWQYTSFNSQHLLGFEDIATSP